MNFTDFFTSDFVNIIQNHTTFHYQWLMDNFHDKYETSEQDFVVLLMDSGKFYWPIHLATWQTYGHVSINPASSLLAREVVRSHIHTVQETCHIWKSLTCFTETFWKSEPFCHIKGTSMDKFPILVAEIVTSFCINATQHPRHLSFIVSLDWVIVICTRQT